MQARWDDSERATLVALLRTRPDGLTWARITAEVASCGSARAVWDQHVPADLFHQTEEADEIASARAEIEAWATAPYDFLTFMDERYPARLRDVREAPPILFTRGTVVTEDRGVCVVGSRNAAPPSLAMSEEISRGLVHRGLTVISGLAAGIDTAAHRAALAEGGRTVAVIGTGIEKYYPAANAALQERIARDGLVLSQFWPTAQPSRSSFPMRNAVMSAYGLATIVVAAGETSGARIQARVAVEHGRPVILTHQVVQQTTWGENMIGRPGVAVVHDAEEALGAVDDVLESEAQVSRWLSRT